MVRRVGLEPTTHRLKVCCYYQLSYQRISISLSLFVKDFLGTFSSSKIYQSKPKNNYCNWNRPKNKIKNPHNSISNIKSSKKCYK